MNDKQLEVWSIRDGNEKNPRSYWKHAGRAFVNSDGSINVLLDVLPIDGKLQIRKRKENELGDPGRETNGFQRNGSGPVEHGPMS
jgi:hypothetical protein